MDVRVLLDELLSLLSSLLSDAVVSTLARTSVPGGKAATGSVTNSSSRSLISTYEVFLSRSEGKHKIGNWTRMRISESESSSYLTCLCINGV